MADISMCMGKDCAVKNLCHRHTAQQSMRQSFFGGPVMNMDGSCDYFWENEKSERERLTPKHFTETNSNDNER